LFGQCFWKSQLVEQCFAKWALIDIANAPAISQHQWHRPTVIAVKATGEQWYTGKMVATREKSRCHQQPKKAENWHFNDKCTPQMVSILPYNFRLNCPADALGFVGKEC